MKKRQLIQLSALALASCSQGLNEKPNILIIHTDEHNFRTLSCYQDRLPEAEGFVWGKGCNSTTPNIDRLADEGAIFMRYYAVTPVSTPSRAAMMTGRHPNETGSWHNGGRPLREDLPTFATELRDNGYSTSYVGKWHLSADEEKYTFRVHYSGGFTDSRYMMNVGHSPYFTLDEQGKVITAVSDKRAMMGDLDTVHMTDYFTDRTLEIIDRDHDKPFCIMLSIPDPHTPDFARAPYYDMYKDLEPTMPITQLPENIATRPLWANTGKNEAAELKVDALKHYFGMVKHIDDSVGRILDRHEEYGELDNTIVIFTSDHGEMFGEHGRQQKGNPYEASTRVPFVVRYPKSISAGKVITKSYTNEGFAPMILGLAGIENDVQFNICDDSSDLTTDTVEDQHRYSFLTCEDQLWVAAVDDRYKLVLSPLDEPWLFDLIEDPMEMTNLYLDPAHEAVAREIQAALEHKILNSLILRDSIRGLKLGKYSTWYYK